MKTAKRIGRNAAEAVESLDLARHGDQPDEPEVLKTDMGIMWKTALPGLGVLGAIGAASWYLKRRAKATEAQETDSERRAIPQRRKGLIQEAIDEA